MKTHRTTLFTGLVALGTLGACSTTSQLGQTQLGDVDPMYAQFRTPAPEAVALNQPVTADYNKGAYEFQDESLSSKTVNPDLVAQYQNDDQRVDEEQATDEYYVEEYNRPGAYGNQPQVVNNFYGNPNRFGAFGGPGFGAGFYDPFWGPGMGFYDPFWGPGMGFGSPWAQPWGRPGFNVSLGFGWGGGFGRNRWNRFGGFGGMYGMYDPFFNPWGPSMAYGGWGRGFGAWGNPYWGGFYNQPVVIVNNGESFYRRPVSSRNASRMNSSRVANGRSPAAIDRRARASSSSRTSRSQVADVARSRNEISQSRNSSYSRRSAVSPTSRNSRRSSSYAPARSSSSYSRDSQGNRYSSPSRSRSYSTPSYSSPSRGSSRSYGSSNSNYSQGSRSSSSGSFSRGSSGSSRGSSYSQSSSGRSSSSGSSRSRSPR